MKTFKFSRVRSTRENTDVFIILDGNIYGNHSKRVNILYLFHQMNNKYSIFRVAMAPLLLTSENTIVCVEVLLPSQPTGVMSSAVTLPYHYFTGQA